MKIIIGLVAPLFVVLLLNCSVKNYNERELVGQWFSQQWTQDGHPTQLRAWFQFGEDKTYRAVISENQEEGKWWIDGYKLYTQVEGQEKIVVKISSLDSTTLVVDMNRGGQKEQITFSRGR
jgi:hypothetical protein